MRTLLPLLALSIGCHVSPGQGAVDDPPTRPSTPVTSTSSPTSTATTTGATLVGSGAVVCANPDLRAERAFDLFSDGAGWDAQESENTKGRLVVGGGLAAADFDQDGRLDVFLPDAMAPRLFLQQAPLVFTEVSGSHLPTEGVDTAVGATPFDADGDGDLDLWLSRYLLEDVLLVNDGNGSFAGVVADLEPWRSISTAAADLDQDGDLDVFSASYGRVATKDEADPNQLYENLGDGRFTPITDALPLELQEGHTLLTAWQDLDEDGLPDAYTVNDFGWHAPNGHARNLGGVLESVPYTGTHVRLNGMGLAISDLNQDGIPDLAITGWDDYRLLLSDRTLQIWADASVSLGLVGVDGDDRMVAWGIEAGDLDNDGDEDLYTALGYLDGEYEGEAPPLHEPDAIWMWEDGRFTQVAEAWNFLEDGVGRGVVLADLDDNGWLDVLVRDKISGPRIWLARCSDAAWLRVKLRQTGPNPFAIGAVVRLTHDGTTSTRWLRAGGTGHASGGPPEVHFGAAEADSVDLEVTWPDGFMTMHRGVETRQIATITRALGP